MRDNVCLQVEPHQHCQNACYRQIYNQYLTDCSLLFRRSTKPNPTDPKLNPTNPNSNPNLRNSGSSEQQIFRVVGQYRLTILHSVNLTSTTKSAAQIRWNLLPQPSTCKHRRMTADTLMNMITLCLCDYKHKQRAFITHYRTFKALYKCCIIIIIIMPLNM